MLETAKVRWTRKIKATASIEGAWFNRFVLASTMVGLCLASFIPTLSTIRLLVLPSTPVIKGIITQDASWALDTVHGQSPISLKAIALSSSTWNSIQLMAHSRTQLSNDKNVRRRSVFRHPVPNTFRREVSPVTNAGIQEVGDISRRAVRATPPTVTKSFTFEPSESFRPVVSSRDAREKASPAPMTSFLHGEWLVRRPSTSPVIPSRSFSPSSFIVDATAQTSTCQNLSSRAVTNAVALFYS